MFNFSERDYQVNKGDRVAQLIIEKICMADVHEVQVLVILLPLGVGGYCSRCWWIWVDRNKKLELLSFYYSQSLREHI